LVEIAALLVLTAAAILVHGYHPYVEDAEIYIPGIKRILNPALYPFHPEFFVSHARLTFFPNLIASFVRVTHAPLDGVFFCCHFVSILLLLLACWHLGRIFFHDPRAKWGGVALVAALLTIPVAGTALYLMDQYLSPRSLSSPAVLFMVANAIERKFVRLCLWTAFTGLLHPLMVVFGVCFVILLQRLDSCHGETQMRRAAYLLLLPWGLFPAVSGAYREVLNTHSYFFLLRWKWYEWVGIFVPLALLWCLHHLARREHLKILDLVCRALIVFVLIFLVPALLVSLPPLMNFARLQPMRCLHLIYVLFFVIAGGLLAQLWLKNHIWKWVLLFLPLCAGMFFAQRQLFPATAHIEWPGKSPGNQWVKAFIWARDRAPVDAFFALDPHYMNLAGEDQHGFRALAERSRLADRVKDSGAVSMFPELAESWSVQVNALNDWKSFHREDFLRLRNQFDVNWLVLEQPGVADLPCPYSNSAVLVCEIK
jgi:hypothetical protein